MKKLYSLLLCIFAVTSLSAATKFDPILGQLREADGATAKATSAEVATGTNDTSYTTPKAIKDAGIIAPTAASTGTLINGADSKTTPIDADNIALTNSESSNILSKLTWANCKATLKSYFDGIYQAYAVPSAAGNLAKLDQQGRVYDGGSAPSGTNTGDETAARVGTLITGSDSKTTPIDADTVAISNSESSGILSKLTWANAKATLKSYFDGIYTARVIPSAAGNLAKLSITGQIYDGGIGGASAPEIHTSDYTVQASDNGKLLSNSGATSNVIYTLPSRETLGNAFEVGFLNEVNSDEYTTLLLHMDNVGLTDAKGLSTITLNGGVARSDTQSKFGGYSAVFDGNGDYLSAPSNSIFAFGTGNFTIDFWLYATTLNAYNHVWDSRISDADTAGFSIGYTANGKLNLWTDGAFKIQTTGTIGANAWNHIALERNGSTFKIYVNGTADATTWTGTPNFTNQTCTIGRYYDSTTNYMTIGYLDEFRVSKGIARYAGNFSVETAEYASVLGAITIHPAPTDKLPNTVSAHSSIKSTVKGNYQQLRTAAALYEIYSSGVYPTADVWVDQLD
jgi:hypothetical protein